MKRVQHEPDQVRVESLVPAHCEGGSIDHFFENGDELNEQMVQRLEAAREMGLVLRYVARFDADGKARVGVEAVREDHPLASLLPCDNVFAIESRWYRDNPLVIRRPRRGAQRHRRAVGYQPAGTVVVISEI